MVRLVQLWWLYTVSSTNKSKITRLSFWCWLTCKKTRFLISCNFGTGILSALYWNRVLVACSQVWHWQIFGCQFQKSIIMTIKHGLHNFFFNWHESDGQNSLAAIVHAIIIFNDIRAVSVIFNMLVQIVHTNS
jgi:hypothetical protein